ncbi:dienelactone hydrolase family protein [Paractinoplanes atraurantiacus]|uniref:Dienelactone hydrolase n=1 Tax=Paractinoplanes atraurantiacus TaxID=1036182 RepID=A0A285FCB1_9ACTN|nr:dienelactone hydrolase family protein [Actinoplanes atraurantiacus]SNY08959.1 Dienelactone hydrolase [Actinoplanes atraurantiacus]
MGSVAVFHSVYGLRESVLRAAERLRHAGHDVVAPDLYGLPAADDLADGFALADKVGWAGIVERARDAVRTLPPEAVLMGFSMGVGVIEALLPERPRTAGVVMVSGAGAIDSVRPGLRAQLHVADPDAEFVPPAAVEKWTESMTRAEAVFEVYRYPGVGHLWVDEDLPDYDCPAAGRFWDRCAEFLRLS